MDSMGSRAECIHCGKEPVEIGSLLCQSCIDKGHRIRRAPDPEKGIVGSIETAIDLRNELFPQSR